MRLREIKRYAENEDYRAKCLERRAKHYAENIETEKQRRKKHYEENKVKEIERRKKWAKENSDKQKEYNREWYNRDADNNAAKERKRRDKRNPARIVRRTIHQVRNGVIGLNEAVEKIRESVDDTFRNVRD